MYGRYSECRQCEQQIPALRSIYRFVTCVVYSTDNQHKINYRWCWYMISGLIGHTRVNKLLQVLERWSCSSYLMLHILGWPALKTCRGRSRDWHLYFELRENHGEQWLPRMHLLSSASVNGRIRCDWGALVERQKPQSWWRFGGDPLTWACRHWIEDTGMWVMVLGKVDSELSLQQR